LKFRDGLKVNRRKVHRIIKLNGWQRDRLLDVLDGDIENFLLQAMRKLVFLVNGIRGSEKATSKNFHESSVELFWTLLSKIPDEGLLFCFQIFDNGSEELGFTGRQTPFEV